MRSSSAAVGCSVMKPSQNLLSWQVFVATCRTRSISQAAVLLDIDRRLKQNLANRYSIRVIGPFNPPLVRQNCSVLLNRWSQDFRLH